MGYLVEVRERGKSSRRLVVDDRVEVGRTAADVRVEDTQVSRRHLLLTVTSAGLAVLDLGSSNGTTVNGASVAEATVRPGHVIGLGQSEIEVICVAGDPQQQGPAGWTESLPPWRTELAASADPDQFASAMRQRLGEGFQERETQAAVFRYRPGTASEHMLPRLVPAVTKAPRSPDAAGRRKSGTDIGANHQGKVGRVVALIPAHNEAACIVETIRGLNMQSRPPDRVIVIADNCTDDTALLAERAGAETLITRDNQEKKAGALNMALRQVLPTLEDTDVVFSQDADTVCVPEFVETALRYIDGRPDIIVSGRYACKAEHGLLGMMQRNEFARDGRRIDRRSYRTHIVVGTSAMIPVAILRHVHRARITGELPGDGFVYVRGSITEDYELTLAVKTLGYRTFSPPECRAITDVMPTPSKLWHQRVRWWRGGFEDLRRYGWSRVTRVFVGLQLAMLFSILTLLIYVAAVTATLLSDGGIPFALAWISLTAIFVTDRVVTVRKAGPFAMFIASLMIVEIIYDVFIQATYIAGAIKAAGGKQAAWKET